LFDETLCVYVRAGGTFRYDGLDSLSGRHVGVLRGWSYGEAFDRAVKNGLILAEETVTDVQNIEKLRFGRLDALVATRASADPALAERRLDAAIVPANPPLLISPAYIAFNKSAAKQALVARINAALKAMRADGTYGRIVAGAGR
jgi:polar amino acid transport system substrate-binding protein